MGAEVVMRGTFPVTPDLIRGPATFGGREEAGSRLKAGVTGV